MNPHRRRATFAATFVLLPAAMLPAALQAQGHPNLAVGLSPESAYDSAGIDNIGLFGGALTVGPIPIGPRYTVSSTLSYGLSATLANNVWDYFPMEGGQYIEARPSRLYNAGLGWTISLGELWHPGYAYNTTDEWVYVDELNGAHRFYSQLHAWEEDGDSNFSYSRDGGFIRFVKVDDWNVWIETPDGLRRKFEKPGSRFRLTRIEDRFGNWVKVAYNADETHRTITDSQGRAHHVYLRTDLHWVGPAIELIDFEGPNGQRLHWTFDYQEAQRDRSCKDTYPDNNDRILMGFLTRINRPDGSKFEMLEAGQPAYWDGCDGGMYDRPGMLKRITLPTGGAIAYDYQRYDFPGGDYPADYYQSATGVKTRKTFDRDGSLIGTTTYSYVRENNEMQMRVLSPTGECSRHYFAANPDPHTSTGAGWDYGLPYSERFTSGGRYLSSEVWTGHNGTTCTGTKLRSTYVTFAHDPLPNLGGNPSNWYNTNRRLSGSRTVFHDNGDRYVDTALTGYDGVGHYRTATTTGNISAMDVERTVKTNFNSGRQPFTPWPVADAWILGTFDFTRADEPAANGQTVAKAEYQFNTNTGALTCQRILRSGASRSGADIVTEYLRNGAGNVWQVRTRGGDGAGLDTGAVCAGSGGSGANFQYTAGVPDKVRPIGTNGALLGYFTYDATIDPGTGWVTVTRDPSGQTTSYAHDALGRVTSVTPQEGASSSTTYTLATGSTPAKVQTTVSGSGVTLSDAEVIFDGLGRTIEQRRRVPDHGWVSTYTTYDASGRVVSQTLANDPAKRVQYLQYDPFGRPGVIRPPEGSGHDVLLSYSGVGSVTRQVKVGMAEGEVYQSWISRYDSFGRLSIVIEPGAAVGQETGETLRAGYAYDVAGRLTHARTVDGATGIEQVRTFTYDNRGFLLSETHPELGTGSGAGSFTYADYDAFGNPGRVTNAARDLRFVYDVYGRLTQVRDMLNSDLIVKSFAYDTAPGRGEGKLAEAKRHNRVTLPGGGSPNIQVTESYRYEGPAGALSSRTTHVNRAGGLEFEEQYAYNGAGQLTGLTYPACLDSACGQNSPLPARTVNFNYNLGHLRSVPGFTSTLTYHPDSSWATIPHANGVTDNRAVQTGNPGRTARLYSTGASSNYNSGFFTYDGAGHIAQMGTRGYVYDAVGRLKGTGAIVSGVWDPEAMVVPDGPWVASGPVPDAGGWGEGSTPAESGYNNQAAMPDSDPSSEQYAVEDPSGSSGETTSALASEIAWEWQYKYDAFGNLKEHTQTLPDGTPQTRTFAINVQKNRLASASYDATGNLKSWGGGAYGYDPAGNLQSVGPTTVHIYTASDERIATLYSLGAGYPLEETYTLRSAGGQVLREVAREASMPAGAVVWNRDYVWRGGQLLASVQPTSSGGEWKWHYTLNHVGSPVLLTKGDAVTYARFDHAPFGEDMSPSSNPPGAGAFPLRFTGHERDSQAAGTLDDLDYMHARHYTPYIGRFLQVDPILGSTGSPQSWNRYAYVGNDPVNFTDPTGMWWCPWCLPPGFPDEWITVTPPPGGGGGDGGGPYRRDPSSIAPLTAMDYFGSAGPDRTIGDKLGEIYRRLERLENLDPCGYVDCSDQNPGPPTPPGPPAPPAAPTPPTPQKEPFGGDRNGDGVINSLDCPPGELLCAVGRDLAPAVDALDALGKAECTVAEILLSRYIGGKLPLGSGQFIRRWPGVDYLPCR